MSPFKRNERGNLVSVMDGTILEALTPFQLYEAIRALHNDLEHANDHIAVQKDIISSRDAVIQYQANALADLTAQAMASAADSLPSQQCTPMGQFTIHQAATADFRMRDVEPLGGIKMRGPMPQMIDANSAYSHHA